MVCAKCGGKVGMFSGAACSAEDCTKEFCKECADEALSECGDCTDGFCEDHLEDHGCGEEVEEEEEEEEVEEEEEEQYCTVMNSSNGLVRVISGPDVDDDTMKEFAEKFGKALGDGFEVVHQDFDGAVLVVMRKVSK